MIKVPTCVCQHPLDSHDVKTGECILHGCSCTRFQDLAGGWIDKQGIYHQS